MKLKKHVLGGLLLVTLIGSITIVSCQQDINTDISPLDNYEKVAKLHNEGLEYVFNYVKDRNSRTRAENGKSNLKNLSKRAIDKFLEKENIAPVLTRALADNEDVDLDEVLNFQQKFYYDKLILVVLDRSLNYEATQKAVLDVTREIQDHLTTEEASPLLYGTAIAKYTLEYWYTNWNKWRIELGGVDATTFSMVTRTGTPESPDDDFSWKDVGQADIAGGVGGAVGGAIGGAMVGGVGAGPGAAAGAVTGAVGGSVGSAVDQLLDWL